MDSPDVDEHGRPEPPLLGDELATLTGFLDFQRATFSWKCARLDADAFDTTVGASTLTLGGMMKHLALVEDSWFSQRLLGREPAEVWGAVDWEADRDWDFHSAADDRPDDLRALWHASVERSRDCVREALERGGLDQRIRKTWPDGRGPSLRWVLVHMIEEYARHNGHADLIREAIDGETGE